MNHSIKSLILGGSILATAPVFAGVATEVAPAPVPAPESSVAFEVFGGYHTIYEFRGADFGDDMFDAGFNVSNTFSNGISLNGGVWYADTQGGSNQFSFNELDVFVGIGKTFGQFDLTAGYTYYTFPDSPGSLDTHEFSVGVGTEIFYGIGTNLTYFHDVDLLDAGYLEFSASKSFELCSTINLDLSAGAAWSFNYTPDTNGGGLDGFNHWYVKAAAPWNFYGDFTITPYVKYVDVANDFASEINSGTSEDNFFGGISLSYSF